MDLLLLNRFQTSTVLARVDTLRELGGFDPALDGVEDWDLWLRCAGRGTVVKLEDQLVRYRDTPASYSKDGRRVHATMRALLERELPASGLSSYRQREVRACHELRFVVGFVAQDRPDLARELVRDLGRDGLVTAVPGATGHYLLPYLVRRRMRRMRRNRWIRWIRPVQPLRLRG